MPKLLIVTTIAGAIKDFILPFVRYFRNQNWQVDGISVDITSNEACVAELDHVWDVPWPRNPLDPRNLVVAVPRIQEIVTQGNYDLVHAHTPVAAFVTRYAISRLKMKQKPKVIYNCSRLSFSSTRQPTDQFYLFKFRTTGWRLDGLLDYN